MRFSFVRNKYVTEFAYLLSNCWFQNLTFIFSNLGPLTVEWEGLSANIVRPDVQATNGIIHVIDRVMMKRRDLTKSGTVSWCPSFLMLVLSVIAVLIQSKL